MADWSDVSLSDLIEIKHGFAFKGEYFYDEPPGDILLTPGNFAIGGGFQLTRLKYYRGPRQPNYTLRPGDLLVTMTDLSKQGDTLGYPAIVPDDGRTYLHNQRLGKVCPKFPDADLKFIYWLMRSREYRNEILSSHSGSAVKHTSPSRILKFRFQMPGKEERQLITNILSSLEDRIELNRRTNETLEAMAQAVFRDWFIDFGPVRRKAGGAKDALAVLGGLVPDPARASEIAALFPDALEEAGPPEGWTDEAFSSLVSIMGGGTPKTSIADFWNGNIPWFSVVDTPTGADCFVFETEKSITQSGLAQSSAQLAPANTTIISARGTVGNVALAGREMAFNQSCYGLRSSIGDLPFFTFLAATYVTRALRSVAHGSVFPTITRQTFDNVRLVRAPAEVIDTFEGFVSPLFQRIRAAGVENRTLAETRDLLLPGLMSGRVRAAETGKALA